jgi:hypothetical protein
MACKHNNGTCRCAKYGNGIAVLFSNGGKQWTEEGSPILEKEIHREEQNSTKNARYHSENSTQHCVNMKTICEWFQFLRSCQIAEEANSYLPMHNLREPVCSGEKCVYSSCPSFKVYVNFDWMHTATDWTSEFVKL